MKLFHQSDRSPEESLEMAECCLGLIEAGDFSARQTERVRMLLNQVGREESAQLPHGAGQADPEIQQRIKAVRDQLALIENRRAK